MKLTTLSDQSLHHSLVALVGRERCLVVTFLEHLAEFERRRLFVPLGFATLFDYLTRFLRLPNGSAYRRMVCARLLARFPQAGERLRDGRLSLASLAKLKDALTAENAQELLERAAGKTEQEVEELACSYPPRPVPQRDLLRRQPAAAVAPELPLPLGSSPPPAEKIEPLTEDRFRWHLSFGRTVRDKLERARALLSHELPDGDGEAILDRALDALLVKLERRKGLVARPRTAELSAPRPGARYIPAAVRRAVWERDRGRCTWPVEGGICGSTYQIEFEHDLEVALGGASTVENVHLRCRRHNLHKAELHLGRAFMQKFTAGAKSTPERGATEPKASG